MVGFIISLRCPKISKRKFHSFCKGGIRVTAWLSDLLGPFSE